MLTPAFEITQDDVYLTIVIQAKYTKISETEIFFEDHDFKFYSKPYFLRLNLPGPVKSVEEVDDVNGASYDAEKGIFTVKVPKADVGKKYEDLDLISKLLAPRRQNASAIPAIEVIGGNDSASSTADTENEIDVEDIDWQIEQHVFQYDLSEVGSEYKYGFANQKSGIFLRIQDEFSGVIDVKDADTKSRTQRHLERIQQEAADFNDDHYMADMFDDESIAHLLKYEPPWRQQYEKCIKKTGVDVDELITLTENEKDKLRKLPSKEHLLSSDEQHIVGLGLVDLIFAYAYHCRTTEGEPNVESGWTIAKISPTLSWLETHSSLRDAVISSVRRSLCYPLYRSWELSKAVLKDVECIFSLGRKQLLKCLLSIHSLFIDCDSRYILNDLYITDYCIWIQQINKKFIQSLAEALHKFQLSKNDVQLDLEELEAAALCVAEEEKMKAASNVASNSGGWLDTVCEEVENLNISSDVNASMCKDTEITSFSHKETVQNVETCSDVYTSEDSADYYLDSDDESSDEGKG